MRISGTALRTALLLALTATAAMAAMHNRLVNSSPAEHEELTASPGEIRLWFAEPAIPRLSGITLLDADSNRITLGKVEATDTNVSVTAKLAAPLPPGRYTVSWRTASEDGHVIRGRYVFTRMP